jgi:chitinase
MTLLPKSASNALRLTCLTLAICLRLSIPAACENAPAASAPQRPLLVGYFPQWGLYNQPQYLVKNLISGTETPLVDQINYAQGFVTNGHCSIADPNADLNYTFTAAQTVDGTPDSPSQPFRGNLHQLQELKRKFPHIHIIISLEGRGSDFAIDAQPENREAFVASCVDIFLKGNFAPGITVPNLFDGIDVDWEYPHEPDADNYKALLLELRRQMDALRPGLLLTVAVGPSPRMYDGTDMGEIGRIVDQVGLMTYDFVGPWSQTTGFVSPLAGTPDHDGGTVTHSVNAYLAAGVPADKLLVGLPFYGYGWHQVTEADNGLFQEGIGIRGDQPYSHILGLIGKSTVYRDPLSQAPWLFDGDIFWTYEDPTSIAHKTSYVRQQQLGGIMIWELGEDAADATLLRATHTGLTQPTIPSGTAQKFAPPSSTKAE